MRRLPARWGYRTCGQRIWLLSVYRMAGGRRARFRRRRPFEAARDRLAAGSGRVAAKRGVDRPYRAVCRDERPLSSRIAIAIELRKAAPVVRSRVIRAT